MTEAGRVLISCAHVWPLMDRYASRLEDAGVVYDIPVVQGQQLEEDDLIPIIGLYDGILAGDDKLSARVLAYADRLKIISKWGVGVDAIDIPYAESRAIKVTNTPGVFANELADYALGYLLLISRRQHIVDRLVHSGEWPKLRGESLSHKTIGLIGVGSSGREFARRLSVLGLTIVAIEPDPPDRSFLAETRIELVDLPELLDRSDIISLHTPATPLTTHIINPTSLAAMRDGVWLINISRGALIDEEALVAALETGKVGAAALDVFETEPLPVDHPLMRQENVILGSHNGSNTVQAAERTTDLAIRNLLDEITRYVR